MNSQRLNGGVLGSGRIKKIITVITSFAGLLRRAVVQRFNRYASVQPENRTAVVPPSSRYAAVPPDNRKTSE